MIGVSSEPELPEWLRPPALKVPLAEAQAQLASYIAVGDRIAAEALKTNTFNVKAFLKRVAQWREHTGRWLAENLGGQVADEYSSACVHAYMQVWRDSDYSFFSESATRQRADDIESETRALDSILSRLPQLLPASGEAPTTPNPPKAPDPVTALPSSGASVQAGGRQEAPPAVDRRTVMVIYGHDIEANDALFDWLRRIGLKPLEFNQLVQATGTAIPYTGDAVRKAFRMAHVVIAFFTPDEHVLDRWSQPGHGDSWRFQARPNVLIEAGMALITHPDCTVLVLLGPQELPSDLAGLSYVRLDHDDARPLQDLATRLHKAGCETDLTGTSWLDPHRFPDRSGVSAAPPAS